MNQGSEVFGLDAIGFAVLLLAIDAKFIVQEVVIGAVDKFCNRGGTG